MPNWFINIFVPGEWNRYKKSHTCEEGGAPFRISVWHLLMNFEKLVKAEFLQNEKNWRYHHCHICTKNHNHMRYSSWDTEWDRMFCHFGPFFPFYPSPIPPNPENQNFESMIKAFGNVMILILRNKKHDHVMYDYSDMECDRHFFVILGHILLFYPTTDPEN